MPVLICLLCVCCFRKCALWVNVEQSTVCSIDKMNKLKKNVNKIDKFRYMICCRQFKRERKNRQIFTIDASNLWLLQLLSWVGEWAIASEQSDNAISQQKTSVVQILIWKIIEYREHYMYNLVSIRSFEVRVYMYWLTQSAQTTVWPQKVLCLFAWFPSNMSCRFAVLISDSIFGFYLYDDFYFSFLLLLLSFAPLIFLKICLLLRKFALHVWNMHEVECFFFFKNIFFLFKWPHQRLFCLKFKCIKCFKQKTNRISVYVCLAVFKRPLSTMTMTTTTTLTSINWVAWMHFNLNKFICWYFILPVLSLWSICDWEKRISCCCCCRCRIIEI